jgi:hypothetical protein
VARLILAKAEGNPFFVEELIRSLIDQGLLRRTDDGGWTASAELERITIPDTLRTVNVSKTASQSPCCAQAMKVVALPSVMAGVLRLRALGPLDRT